MKVVLSISALQHVDIGLQVQLWRTRVEPVGVISHGKKRASGRERRKRFAFDTDATGCGDAIERAGLEDIGPGVDEVRRRFFTRRLLDEGQHAAIVGGWYYAKV